MGVKRVIQVGQGADPELVLEVIHVALPGRFDLRYLLLQVGSLNLLLRLRLGDRSANLIAGPFLDFMLDRFTVDGGSEYHWNAPLARPNEDLPGLLIHIECYALADRFCVLRQYWSQKAQNY
jgi:hypothetical protein